MLGTVFHVLSRRFAAAKGKIAIRSRSEKRMAETDQLGGLPSVDLERHAPQV
jgi:hypothetical protein